MAFLTMEVLGRYRRARAVIREHVRPANTRLAVCRPRPRVTGRALTGVPASYPRRVVSSQNEDDDLCCPGSCSRSAARRPRIWSRCVVSSVAYPQQQPAGEDGGRRPCCDDTKVVPWGLMGRWVLVVFWIARPARRSSSTAASS